MSLFPGLPYWLKISDISVLCDILIESAVLLGIIGISYRFAMDKEVSGTAFVGLQRLILVALLAYASGFLLASNVRLRLEMVPLVYVVAGGRYSPDDLGVLCVGCCFRLCRVEY